MRRIAIFLLILVVAFVGALPSHADVIVDDGSSGRQVSSYGGWIEITTDTGITLIEPLQTISVEGSYNNVSSNSTVNALYYGSNVLVRKATQYVSGGYLRPIFYTTYTNLTNIQGYSVKIHLNRVDISGDMQENGIPFDVMIPYFYVAYGGGYIGDMTCNYQYIERYDDSLVGNDRISNTEIYNVVDATEVSLYHLEGLQSGQLFSDNLALLMYKSAWDALNPNEYVTTEYIPIYNVEFEYYVSLDDTTNTVSYSLGQEFFPGGTVPKVYSERHYHDVTVLDADFFSFVGELIEGVFEIEIFGVVTFGALFWSILGLFALIIFLKFFAGG